MYGHVVEDEHCGVTPDGMTFFDQGDDRPSNRGEYVPVGSDQGLLLQLRTGRA